MSSIREQARVAAKDSAIKFYGTGESNAELYKMAGADAASDVWETLLSRCHVELEHVLLGNTKNRQLALGELVNDLREALS